MRPTVHLLALTIAAMPGATFADDAGIEIVTGVTETGRATPEWQAMIRKRLPDDAFEVVRELEKPLTGNERAWANMIRARAAQWKAETAALADVFRPIKAPDALIVLGNRGGEDAFTHDPHTIGFDLERLHALYGAAASAENQARMDRFFRHEYTHLLQKAWFVEHPVPLDSPLGRTLTEIFTEGMGNYHSLSDSWRNQNGKAAEKTLETLALLEPRFIARLAATACTTEETAAELDRKSVV